MESIWLGTGDSTTRDQKPIIQRALDRLWIDQLRCPVTPFERLLRGMTPREPFGRVRTRPLSICWVAMNGRPYQYQRPAGRSRNVTTENDFLVEPRGHQSRRAVMQRGWCSPAFTNLHGTNDGPTLVGP